MTRKCHNLVTMNIAMFNVLSHGLLHNHQDCACVAQALNCIITIYHFDEHLNNHATVGTMAAAGRMDIDMFTLAIDWQQRQGQVDVHMPSSSSREQTDKRLTEIRQSYREVGFKFSLMCCSSVCERHADAKLMLSTPTIDLQ